ncbi:MAG TPA: glutaredoxin family protein [Candidatus Binatia bacterium]|nr:glutaredoxin family protein [Candidatus Binatia bacterium]
MNPKLTLYSRNDCCLCDEMKAVIRQAAAMASFDFEEIDIDTNSELRERYNDQVPILFIDGRKAFKYRVTVKQLANRISRKPSRLITSIANLIGKGSS